MRASFNAMKYMKNNARAGPGTAVVNYTSKKNVFKKIIPKI